MSVNVFEGTDHAARISVKGATLTIEFTFDSIADAAEVATRLREAHRTGESVAFELTNPLYPVQMQ